MFAREGALRYVTTGKINRQSVICIAPGRDKNCRPDGLILTLQINEKPTAVLNSLFNSAFKVSGGNPIVRGEKVVYDLNQVFGSETTNETNEENTK
jgi:molybdenum cofactor biosynthesis enzyme MoaA